MILKVGFRRAERLFLSKVMMNITVTAMACIQSKSNCDAFSSRYRWYGILGSIMVHAGLLMLPMKYSELSRAQQSPAIIVRFQRAEPAMSSFVSISAPSAPISAPAGAQDEASSFSRQDIAIPIGAESPEPVLEEVWQEKSLTDLLPAPLHSFETVQEPAVLHSADTSAPEAPAAPVEAPAPFIPAVSRQTSQRIEKTADSRDPHAPLQAGTQNVSKSTGEIPEEPEHRIAAEPLAISASLFGKIDAQTSSAAKPPSQPTQTIGEIPRSASAFASKLLPLSLPLSKKDSVSEPAASSSPVSPGQTPELREIDTTISENEAIAEITLAASSSQPEPVIEYAQVIAHANSHADGGKETAVSKTEQPAGSHPQFTGEIEPAIASGEMEIKAGSIVPQSPPVEPATAEESPQPKGLLTDEKPIMNTAEDILKKLTVLLDTKTHYPASALKRKIEGTVVLAVEIGSDGRLLRISFRSRSGSSVLDDAAVSLVKSVFPLQAALTSPLTVIVPVEYRIPK